MPVVDAEVDERALIVNLTVLRRLIEEEHALEVDRAACIPPLAFETATPVGDANPAAIAQPAATQATPVPRGKSVVNGRPTAFHPWKRYDCISGGRRASGSPS